MKDILGEALVDFYNGNPDTLWINNKYGDPEEMPLEIFFREEEDLTEIEKIALLHCKGTILDIGAGAGALALLLQDHFDTTAIEYSEGACQVMKALGVKTGIIGDVFDYKDGLYDTLLLLMNGVGLVGEIDKLSSRLEHFKSLLKDGGQILLDSSDISYLYEEVGKPKTSYYGQLEYQYEYKGKKGDWFNWLYVDFQTLNEYSSKVGLKVEKIFEDENEQYLAKLTITNS